MDEEASLPLLDAPRKVAGQTVLNNGSRLILRSIPGRVSTIINNIRRLILRNIRAIKSITINEIGWLLFVVTSVFT